MSNFWTNELSTKESVIMMDLCTVVKQNNQLPTLEKMIAICGYSSDRYFRKHIGSLIEKRIILVKESEEGRLYFFNHKYIECNDLGPMIYQVPFEMEEAK